MDRNFSIFKLVLAFLTSLSARRAWIEISFQAAQNRQHYVALRKESVDRNILAMERLMERLVALRKESVDRNFPVPAIMCSTTSRSPQGERG